MNVNIVDYQLWLVDGDRKYGYRGLLKGFRAQISFRPPFLFVLRRCHLPIIVGTIRTDYPHTVRLYIIIIGTTISTKFKKKRDVSSPAHTHTHDYLHRYSNF